MESYLAATAVLSPLGLMIFLGLPAAAIFVAARPGLSALRLVGGYVGALVLLAALLFGSIPFNPTETLDSAAATYVVAAAITVAGISIIGVPAVVVLFHEGVATAPRLLIVSVVVSLLFAFLFHALSGSNGRAAVTDTGLLVLSHGLLTIGFAVGARLPWRRSLAP